MPTCCRTNRSQVARYGRTVTVRQFTVFAAISFLGMMIGAQTPVISKTAAESAIEACKLQLTADAGYWWRPDTSEPRVCSLAQEYNLDTCLEPSSENDPESAPCKILEEIIVERGVVCSPSCGGPNCAADWHNARQ